MRLQPFSQRQKQLPHTLVMRSCQFNSLKPAHSALFIYEQYTRIAEDGRFLTGRTQRIASSIRRCKGRLLWMFTF